MIISEQGNIFESRHQVGGQDYHEALDEYLDQQAEEILEDRELDLSVVIADYCELGHWAEYDRLIVNTCRKCPELKAFLLLAARRQALVDLNAD